MHSSISNSFAINRVDKVSQQVLTIYCYFVSGYFQAKDSFLKRLFIKFSTKEPENDSKTKSFEISNDLKKCLIVGFGVGAGYSDEFPVKVHQG